MMLYTFGLVVACFTMTCHGLLPPAFETCSVINQACEARDNLINAFPKISSIQECRELCKNTSDCEVYSYYGDGSLPFKNYCMTFSNCFRLHDCEDCFTEIKPCFDVCEIINDGSFVQDTVDVITNLKHEHSCVIQCRMNPDCKFYTYYTASDHNYPSMCVLQSSIEGPMKPCLHCRTGFPDCRVITTDFCHFSVGDKNDKLTSYKAMNTSKITTLIFPAEALFLFSLCELTITAIGGGGSGYTGGGGSGYIETAIISSIRQRLIFIHVEARYEESRVDTAVGETIVRAHPGKSGGNHEWGIENGGDGYSGGGGGGTQYTGSSGGFGGSNGGDGQDSPDGGRHGGKGSGLDISTIALEHFKLTPAAGGESCKLIGGGGGGVLVDGQGPHNGRSYGAGGGDHECSNVNHPAQQGIVLIEIKKKQ